MTPHDRLPAPPPPERRDPDKAIKHATAAMRELMPALKKVCRAFLIFAVAVNHPKATGKKRAFLIRKARRNIRARSEQS